MGSGSFNGESYADLEIGEKGTTLLENIVLFYGFHIDSATGDHIYLNHWSPLLVVS